MAVAGRLSTVLHLWDTDLEYRLEGGGIHRVCVGARVHPLFLFLLERSPWAQLLGALHVRAAGGGIAGRTVAPVGSLGGGVDVPLTEDDAGHSGWLGLSVDHTWTSAAVGAEGWAGQLRLGLRFNGP